MVREAELQVFSGVADIIGRNYHVLPSDEITGFMAMIGQTYNRELMVIGRAVNGWTKGWKPESLNSDTKIQEFANSVLDSVTKAALCPMQWVSSAWGNKTTYNTKHSAFWRVIRRVVGELKLADIEDVAWPSRLVWSNLYKISPAVGGNPSEILCSLQLNSCISLLEEEIRIYKPKRILFLTGIVWAEAFVNRLAPNITLVPEFRYVEAVGNATVDSSDTTIVVAVHPQGKQENIWVKEVVKALRWP